MENINGLIKSGILLIILVFILKFALKLAGNVFGALFAIAVIVLLVGVYNQVKGR